MRIVFALFLVGAANSASIPIPPANGQIQYGYRNNKLTSVHHASSSDPSTLYMSVDDLLGPTVVLTQNAVPAAQPVEASVAPTVKATKPEPYVLSGPVAEYTIPFGIDIPGIDFAANELSQPDPVPIQAAPAASRGQVKAISAPAPAPAVNIYSAPAVTFMSAPAPATSLLETYFKVDDGALEQVNPTHVSYNAEVSVPAPAPVVEAYAAPALEFIPAPSPAVSTLESFYKVDDGHLEQVNPTHVSYRSHATTPVPVPEPIPVVTWWTPDPVVKSNPAPVVVDPFVATPLPIMKSNAKATQYMSAKDLLGSTFTPSVKSNPAPTAEEPAPAPAKVWWTPDPVVKSDPAPAAEEPKPAPAKVWWTPDPVIEKAEVKKAEVKKVEIKESEGEPIVEEEGGDEATPAESKSTDETEMASKDTEGSTGTEDSKGSEGSERAEDKEESEGSEGAEEEKEADGGEEPNTKSEDDENSVDEAETKSVDAEEEEEEEEDSDERKR